MNRLFCLGWVNSLLNIQFTEERHVTTGQIQSALSYLSDLRSEVAHDAASKYNFDFIKARKYLIRIYEGGLGRKMTTNELEDLEGILERISKAEKQRRSTIMSEKYRRMKDGY